MAIRPSVSFAIPPTYTLDEFTETIENIIDETVQHHGNFITLKLITKEKEFVHRGKKFKIELLAVMGEVTIKVTEVL